MSTNDVEIAQLKARIAALEAKADPQPRPKVTMERYDPTANFQLPRSAVEALRQGVNDRDLAEITAEGRRPTSLPAARPSEQRTIPSQRGWVDAKPLEKWKPGD